MKTNIILIIFFVMCIVSPGSLWGEHPRGEHPRGELPRGEIIDRVACQNHAGQSYALYLPSAYSPEKRWPVIYCFEPAARGTLPLGNFKGALEKYGYIMVVSNNARNGPFEPITRAATAMWEDTRQRLSLDERRVYVAGFSGGARVASVFSYITRAPVAGVIACGAGLSTRIKPEALQSPLYYGIVGLADFNYRELIRLDGELDHTVVRHFISVFDGPHQWPPPDICRRAVEWMEIHALKRATRSEPGGALVSERYAAALGRAGAHEKAGRILLAVAEYEGAVDLFDGLTDVNAAKAGAEALRRDKTFKKSLKAEKKRQKKEVELVQNFSRAFTLLKKNARLSGPSVLARDLKIPSLRKLADRAGADPWDPDVAQARRLLHELRIHAYREWALCLGNGDHRRAEYFVDIAALTGSREPVTLYTLACGYAATKNKKKALKCLGDAIKEGFDDAQQLRADPDLDPLRQEAAFKDMIQALERKM